jgi:hypothetical protein
MENVLDNDDYIEFLISIKPLCEGKMIIESSVRIDGVHIYDAHASICCAIKGFMFAVIEGGWVAFIWDEEVYTYPCSVSETLLTDTHKQSILN